MPQAYFGGFLRRPSLAEVKRYMRGDCAYLALAWARLEPQAQLVEVARQHFAVCLSPGVYGDIRGRMTEAQLRDGLPDQALICPMDRDEVLALLATGVYSDGPYVPHREKVAQSLLRQLGVGPAPPRARPR